VPAPLRPRLHGHPGGAPESRQHPADRRLNETLKAALERAIITATGKLFVITSWEPVSGGCIHRSFVIADASRRFFAKTNDAALAETFIAEADGLAALAGAGMRVPMPVSTGSYGGHAWLILEHLDLRAGKDADFARLGQAMATLHARHGAQFGWSRDNFIGPTRQANRSHATWASFWREERLRPQLQHATRDGHPHLAQLGEQLCDRVDRLLGAHAPQASLLHGDLWGGNAAFLADGRPVLFDPAIYYGDRETDLAMTELFGGFAPAFYDAYREAAPLPEGYEERRLLYNLYHVLNHAHLFGGSYPAQAERMLRRLIQLTQ
jgi:protein-ribulosamine 3-kinase